VGDVIALGTRLRQRREELGLTQAQAARELDVARTAYRLWEMQAARPAPDRWRSIATWLGITMTAMLLAEELIDEHEAVDAQRLAVGVGLAGAQWDEQSDVAQGDYFSQERAMIADQAALGHITAEDASQLRRVLARVQSATSGKPVAPWQPGQFRKRLPNTDVAPGLARAALAATAVGIPTEVSEDATLLVSELVTNSVRHADSDWVELAVDVGVDLLRIEVSDQSTRTIRPRTPGVAGGWGLTLLGELAARWGIERNAGGKTIWLEFDLTP
jgi:transcriptional regulator with XRE-family HTH domain/anti-sigma regulatory factor (Ser/Thr protein kinase)